MATSWATLITGKTRATIFSEVLAALKTAGLRVNDWAAGAVIRTVLDVAFSGALGKIWEAIPDIVRGGFLRQAQALAEADIASWTADPTGHWLYLLGTEFYGLPLKRAAFAVGTVKYTNTGAGPQTITAAHVVATAGGLRYTPIAKSNGAALPLVIPAGASGYVQVKADQAGSAYNVAGGAITLMTVSLPGVSAINEPDPAIVGQVSWILSSGSDTEAPKQYADRCAFRWGRVTKLQALVTDGYKSLALDAHPEVKKVAVWQNYSHAAAGFRANAVTLYLGTDSVPVAAATADAVKIALLPYVSICDALEVVPCGVQTWVLGGTIRVTDAALIPQVKAAVDAAILAYRDSLDIGQRGRAWEIRAAVNVPGVVDFVETLQDFVPAKNALLQIDSSLLSYLPV